MPCWDNERECRGRHCDLNITNITLQTAERRIPISSALSPPLWSYDTMKYVSLNKNKCLDLVKSVDPFKLRYLSTGLREKLHFEITLAGFWAGLKLMPLLASNYLDFKLY